MLIFLTTTINQILSSSPINEPVEIDELTRMVGPHPRGILTIINILKTGTVPKVNKLLFYGPPGTGKTKYAKEIAEAANCNFIKVSGSDIIDQFIGKGASNIREIFDKNAQAKKMGKEYDPRKPITIICIDEVDAFANKDAKTSLQEYTQTAIALWVALDNLEDTFVIMTTNNRDKIHKTILDRLGANQIKIDLPNNQKRKLLFQLYLSEHPEVMSFLDSLVNHSDGLSHRSIEYACTQAIDHAAVYTNGVIEKIDIKAFLKETKNPECLNYMQRYWDWVKEKEPEITRVGNLAQAVLYIGTTTKKTINFIEFITSKKPKPKDDTSKDKPKEPTD